MINAEDYLGLVHNIIGKYFMKNICIKGYEYNDVAQEGYLALINAIDKFNPKKGVKFITYAYNSIYCSLLKFFRDDKWYMGNPADRLSGKAPKPISMETPIKNTERNCVLGDMLNDENDFASDVIDKLLVHQLINELNEEEKIIVKRLFFENKVQRELAVEFNTSQKNISRIKNAALLKMRREVNI